RSGADLRNFDALRLTNFSEQRARKLRIGSDFSCELALKHELLGGESGSSDFRGFGRGIGLGIRGEVVRASADRIEQGLMRFVEASLSGGELILVEERRDG